MQLDFCNNEAFIFAQKLVNFDGVLSVWDEPAYFLNQAGFAKKQKGERFVFGQRLLKLEARKSAIERWAFDRQKALFVAKPHAHRPAATATKVALANRVARRGQVLVRANHKKLPLYLLRHRLTEKPVIEDQNQNDQGDKSEENPVDHAPGLVSGLAVALNLSHFTLFAHNS